MAAIAQEAGFNVSAEAIVKAQSIYTELSEGELEEVSGGANSCSTGSYYIYGTHCGTCKCEKK
ncbi:hypothetical protein SynBIOSE41_02127 [Synechococcus sp. BIOS-E4-1]|nr:hypothetical protein SynBIOSE41_02127 [Synechococcus sp. BIOS-E4-1]